MPKVLTEDAIAQYEREGNFFPIPILCEDEVADLRGRLEAFEAEQGQPIQGGHRNKSHLLFKWLDDLMRNPRILDVVEDLIGRDILCWNTIFWIKEARSPSYVSWHQDLNYWGLDATDLVSAWLALSPATVESGCMRVLPGSHAEEALPHDDTFHVDNMLTRGQEIAVEVDEADAVDVVLEAGQASLHHGHLFHSSGPNNTGHRRIGAAIRYIAPSMKQKTGDRTLVAHVAGEDRHGHFTVAPPPEGRLLEADFALCRQDMAVKGRILYEGVEGKRGQRYR